MKPSKGNALASALLWGGLALFLLPFVVIIVALAVSMVLAAF